MDTAWTGLREEGVRLPLGVRLRLRLRLAVVHRGVLSEARRDLGKVVRVNPRVVRVNPRVVRVNPSIALTIKCCNNFCAIILQYEYDLLRTLLKCIINECVW